MLSFYSRCLDKHPYMTKCFTTGTLFGIADAVTQTFIQKTQKFDHKRNSLLILTGATFVAPFLHNWYCKILPKITEKVLPSPQKNKLLFVTGKVIIDQSICAPLLLQGVWLVYSLFSTGNFNIGIQRIKTKFFEGIIMNYQIWPIASFINFSIVPFKFQVLFSNCVGVFWNMFLSYLTHR